MDQERKGVYTTGNVQLEGLALTSDKGKHCRLSLSFKRFNCFKMDTFGEPLKVDKILGDGNCLFRASSKDVSFSEENHTLLRASAIQTLESSSNKAAF